MPNTIGIAPLPSTVVGVDSVVSFISANLISLLGLNYYALIWAFVGALVALTQSERMERLRAVIYVALSTFIGALLGTAAGEWLAISKVSLIAVLSLVCGVGWQGMIAAMLKIAEGRFKSFMTPYQREQANDSPQLPP